MLFLLVLVEKRAQSRRNRKRAPLIRQKRHPCRVDVQAETQLDRQWQACQGVARCGGEWEECKRGRGTAVHIFQKPSSEWAKAARNGARPSVRCRRTGDEAKRTLGSWTGTVVWCRRLARSTLKAGLLRGAPANLSRGEAQHTTCCRRRWHTKASTQAGMAWQNVSGMRGAAVIGPACEGDEKQGGVQFRVSALCFGASSTSSGLVWGLG